MGHHHHAWLGDCHAVLRTAHLLWLQGYWYTHHATWRPVLPLGQIGSPAWQQVDTVYKVPNCYHAAAFAAASLLM